MSASNTSQAPQELPQPRSPPFAQGIPVIGNPHPFPQRRLLFPSSDVSALRACVNLNQCRVCYRSVVRASRYAPSGALIDPGRICSVR